MAERNYFGYPCDDWEAAKLEAKKYLIEKVAKLGNDITYGNLALAIKTIDIPAYGDAMSNFLDEMSRSTYDAHGFMLSALVVSQKTGEPGKGFWILAKELNGEQKSWGYWYRNEKKKIWEKYKQS
ncbi:TPA: hypothetical protein ACJL1A_000278 [Neisseria meningitidis]|jgi:hypothetical protein|uniref:hypothetical protein n=1 Tax=Neisseria sicca TaxID=490 RepID=UPI000D2F77D1|nr:hypothetical protein [Neisseria sicca]